MNFLRAYLESLEMVHIYAWVIGLLAFVLLLLVFLYDGSRKRRVLGVTDAVAPINFAEEIVDAPLEGGDSSVASEYAPAPAQNADVAKPGGIAAGAFKAYVPPDENERSAW